ncbi:Drug/metabolite transporter (DMT)-like permease OS=Castellaniella defragrans OX=75697 GN=HNR28_000281 PE=4 SV=1 [Castellaniella defragrans]
MTIRVARVGAGFSAWIPYGYLAVSMFVVGTYVALSKPLVAVFPLFLLGWLRFGIAGVATLGWLRKPSMEPVLTWKIRVLLFLGSFIGSFLFTITMVLGVSRSGAVAAGVIMSAIPAAVAILSRIVLHEVIRPRVLLSIACGVLGIGILAFTQPAADSAAQGDWLGYLLLSGTVLCEACYVVIGKRLTAVLSSKRISALVNLWGFILMMPAGAWIALDFDFAAVSLSSWLLLLFYAMSASIWTVLALDDGPAQRPRVTRRRVHGDAAGRFGVHRSDRVGRIVQRAACAGIRPGAGGLAAGGVARACSIMSCTLVRPPQVLLSRW